LEELILIDTRCKSIHKLHSTVGNNTWFQTALHDSDDLGGNGAAPTCTNFGLWALTAMSGKVKVAKRNSNLSLQYSQLKSITIDISCPVLQTLNENGDALVFLETEEFRKSWQDGYPFELLQFQTDYELGLGGDVSVLVDEHTPMLETIRIRCNDNQKALSSMSALHLLVNICKHRQKAGNTRKLKRLVLYSVFADMLHFCQHSEKGRLLTDTFESVETKPVHKFPFF
jgi:hypothetical protein